MPTYLSEAEVFGKNQQYLSEEEVFGKPANQKRSIADVVSSGISSVVDDVTGGIARHDAWRRAELMARGNEATQAMIADSQASGTAAELQARADSIEAAKPSAVSSIVGRGLDFTRDAAVSGAQGVIGLGESVVGIGDLATGWTGATPGGALKHVGYDPAAAKKALGDLKSDAGKERDAIYESTRGFTETLMTLGTNPGMLADKIFESLAGTVGAGAVGAKAVAAYMPRAVEAATAAGLTGEAAQAFIADKIAKVAIGSAAAAEGAQQAGNLAETARQADVPWKQYAGPAVASGAGTAVIAAASGGVAKRLGIGDIEADIALRGTRGGGVKTDPGFVVNRAVIEAAKEGGLEEMPQSMQEAAWENIAMGRPWDEGLGKAAATGLATGAGMGGGHAVFSRTGNAGDAPASIPGEPADGYIPAAEVLGAETEADKALYTPKPITALDRVAELDAKLNELHPQAAAGDQEAANEWNRLQAERRTLTAGWPAATPGAQITFSTETGSRLEGQYALMEAGDLTTSHDENLRPVATYPAELQPRERERHASELQVQQIVQKLDPARLGESADVATGAPIVGADGLVESGNARTIALKRVYQANGQKADDYRQFIKANADRFGIAPESVDAMQRPVLVRVRTTPVNRAEFARQANAATVARMSPSEQARADAAAIDSLEDLNPDESGDFMSGSSTPFVRRFLAKLATTEQAALIDASGRLSQAGYARIRNAVLAKAYGDSPVLLRMVESMDDTTRNVTKALMRVAPQVAKTREAIGEGALHDADMTPDLMAAVEELASLKEKGVTVEQALAQAGMFGDKLSPEARDLLAFLSDNIRSPRRIADFIQRYLEALEAAGNPNQGSLLGDATAPAKGDLMAAAKRGDDGIEEDAGRRQPAEGGGAGEEDGSQPTNAQGSGGGAGSDEAAGGQAGGVDARAAAAEDFKDALADLGAIVRDYANVARVVPEDTPGLMDTLVRLFDAAMRLGYNDAKKAVAYVKEQLRADDRFKSVWNKIQTATYQKAAKQAADNLAQGADGLFGATQDEAPAAREAITIDGLEYDLDADNFGLNPWPKALKDDDPLLVETLGKDTVTIDGETIPRDVWRDIVVEKYLEGAEPVVGRKPIAFVMGGGGASGKGTIRHMLTLQGRIRQDGAVHLDPDEIKGEIPEYHQIRDAGDHRAAATVHEESSALAKRIKAEAIKGKFDLVYDVTLGDPKKGIAQLQELKDAGYEVRLFGVTVDPRIAVVRADKRARRPDGGRYVPVAELLKAHKNFPLSFELYAGVADIAELWENSDGRRLIAATDLAGDIELLDRQAYDEVVKRSEATNEQARTLREVSLLAGIQTAGSAGSQSRRDQGIDRASGQGTGRQTPEPSSAVEGDQGGRAGGRRGSQEEGGLNERDREPGSGSAQGEGAASAPRTGGQRRTQSVPAGQGSGDLFADDGGRAPDGAEVRVQRDGRPDGEGQDNERRPGAGARARAVRAVGIPAGRDIPAKTGRNYRFGPDDLTYEGGWQKKAAQNVEAVELVKKLEAEGRQATREEQAILAKFIGWGASEIRNTIFGKKIEDRRVDAYRRAKAALEGSTEIPSDHPDFWTIKQFLNRGYYDRAPITKADLKTVLPDASMAQWADLRDRLKAALTEEEWATAERSTQYAHYTSKAIVKSMWGALDRMGFKGGAWLEPGAGIGVFPGLMDSAMATNSAYTGVEMDAISGAILRQLFPDERILVESFVDSAMPDNFYDAAIGNPPFANIPILSDPKYKKFAFSLHDYFFAKSIDKVKPGGLMVFVTSRYTMDKQGDKARKYLGERADLVGAIRLPQTAFMKNAGTEVVTDVLFLRKKVAGETFEQGQSWLGVQEIQTPEGPALINEYFAAHPEMVLGTHSLRGSMYSKNEYTVLPKEGDIEAHFAAAVEKLPADVYRATGAAAQAAQVREIDFNPKAQKEGNYYVSDAGVLMQREGGVGVRADEGKPAKTVEVIKDFVKLRDALKQAHYDQLNDGPWEDSLKALQKEYGAFVKKHGNILQNKAFERATKREDEETGQEIEDIVTWRRFDLLNKINDDPDYTLVEALERLNEETGEITESQFLRERVLEKQQAPRIETPHDALLSVLNDTGKVDLPMIAERIGVAPDEIVAALGTAIYESPSAGWQMADEYLSGNVKQKLKEAQQAAKADKRFERNVEALLAAQPAPVPPSDITAAIGMNWIPANAYEQFLHEKTGVRASVSYNERTGQWNVTATSGWQTPAATVDWGTPQRNAADILEHALTGRPIRITRTEGHGDAKKTVFDAEATEAANQKLAQMRNAFSEWIWTDGERADTLTRLYNDKFNTIVPRKFDGRHLTLPGTTSTIKVFDHVKRGAWRIIQAGNTYLAHAVGSGKTWQMVISAMEQKRLGLINKPMVVVPNHMLQQFAREWLQLYPAARLMVADEKQFHTENRRRFVSRVAMSDVDGVIITHSAFKLLDLDPDFKRQMIEEQLDYLRAALDEAGGEEGKKSRDPKVRDIQNRIEKMEQKLEAAMSSTGKDKNVRFDQLGVDFLYVDEAHEFRKLAFTTQRQVKGIDSSGSDRAFDLYMKTRWLEQKKPGRSLVMASGTPVTNTLAEIYSVQRFMAPGVLADRGLDEFDSWAAMFGQENTEIEADASGKYSPVTRFTKFVNVPELTQMFREFADVLTSDHLAEMLGDKRPKVKDGSRKLIVTPETEDYSAYRDELASRLDASRRWKPSKDQPNNPDPIIKIIGDGRLAAIDMRFIHPSLPSDPESKLNQLADGVIEVYRRTAENEYLGKDGKTEPVKGGVQMVFSDLGFGAGVAEHRGFNARAWIEKRLRDAGIPANQIAFMSDYKKSKAKLKLFQDVNAGKVRILIGSSKNMGTGVNAQQRLVALHHLDTPWYPADLEQREGRIIRQGNKNPLVEIYAYSTKGSYDTVMWQMLASKQRFIDQALSGDSSVRSIDDLTEASQFQIATAMTAGDPRAIQLAGLKADIEKYQRLFRAHEETRMRMRQEYDLAGAWIASATKQLPEAEKVAAKVQDLSGENFKAKADGKTFDKRKEWGEALLASLKDYTARGKEGRIKVGEISGFPVEFVGKITRDQAGKVTEYRTALAMVEGEDSAILARDPADDAVGMAMRATNSLTHLARLPGDLQRRIDESKAKRAALEGRLDAKFQFAGELADKLKEADALEVAMLAAQQAAEAQPAESGAEPKLTRMERAMFAGRMRVDDVRAVVEGFRKVAKNLPTVHVLQDTKDAPRAVQKWLRENDAMLDAAGLFHDGEIYLFASHLVDIAHAQRVFLHEAQHYGLSGLFGNSLDEAMLYLYEHNGALKVKADARQVADRSMSTVRAVEEVLADMAGDGAAKKLTGWKKLVSAVRDWLRKAGWVGTVTDNDVAYLIHRAERFWQKAQKTGYANVKRGRLMRLADDLAEQEKWLSKEAKARGYGSIDELAEKDYPTFEKLAALWRQKHPVKEALLSRAATATPNLTTEQQAEAVIQQKAATPKPLETTLRAVTQATKLDKLTTAAYSKAAALLDRYTPETIKAGIVSDYGIPEAVLDRRAVTEGRQRKQLRAAGALLEKLATLTRAESRVAYAWMNNDDPQAAAHFEEQLPPESLATMREVRSLIDKLSQEAVKLGQLDPEAFKRNRFAYLHRSYVKHTAELSQGETKSRARAISILGDQYKGRGMTDAADMARIKNVAPEWWGRKLKAGQADKGLKGEQFIRLERRAPTGAGTQPLPGIGDRGKGRLLEVAYWPAAEPLPARYGAWDRVGTWEVRGTKGAKLILWRDFTAQERQALGEIDEVRFAIAKTLHAMIHDVETGRYLEWLAQTYAKKEGEEIDGTVVEASERLRDTFKPGEWVKVPEAEIPGTKVKKYGVLAGRYLPGPIWNDVRQMGGHFKPLGETYSAILRAWKSSKTALSPAVHMNNVMANFVMADWHDVTAGHVAKALRLMLSKDEVAAEVLARYGESGGTIGTWATKELQLEQLKPMLEALEKELGIAGSVTGQVGVMSALQLALRGQFPAAWDAFKPSKTGQVPVKAARALIALYEAEDQVFRLAAWLKAKEEGATDLVAGKAARKSFLDYSINAPWVQMMRSTAFPFIAFTYRSVPMLLETAAKKPWKLFKLGLVAGAANALGYLFSGGDEDDERKLLPEEKAGRIWGITPKLVRMPWNDANASPVFLDVRRWVPVGDIFDVGQTHSAIPVLPAMMTAGPLDLLFALRFNQDGFSGKPITLETDTPTEKAQKLADYLYKAFAPNIILLPGTYAWTGAVNAGTGRTDSFGREQSLAQAVISSVGVKVGSYPKDVLQLNAQREAQAKMMEIDRNLTGLKREYQRRGITSDELQEKAAVQVAKKRKVVEDLQKRMAGG